MADTVKTLNPQTGRVEEIAPSALGRAAEASGAHEATPQELIKVQNAQAERDRSANLLEGHVADIAGKVRGIGEAAGFPVDAAVTDTADYLGHGDETRQYLNDLKHYHAPESALGELAGQAGAAVAGSELIGGGSMAPKAASALGRIAHGVLESGIRGGLENLVIGTTSDINETALGNADLAGEKLVAQMPKHFAVGAGMGALLGGAGAVLGEGWAGLAKKAPEMLEHGADAAVGREFGGDAALGAELRGKVGGIPRSADDVVGALTKEQGAYRQAAEAETAAAKDALIGQHVADAGKATADQEARRIATAKEGQAALDELANQHKAARDALDAQHGEAASAAVKLEGEVKAARQQLKNLAGDLDKVKGAELPSADNIVRGATEAFQGTGPSLTPPSPRSAALFNEWADTFSKKFAEPGSLTFKELDGVIDSLNVLEKRQRVVSGWGSDPEVKAAFDAMKKSAKAEFDRASEVTAGAAGQAQTLSAARLRETIPSLQKAHADALDNVDNIQKSVFDFNKQAETEAKIAQRAVKGQMREFERKTRLEDRDLDRAQRAEEKGIPKASKETPIDTLLGKVKSRPKETAGPFDGIASTGALLSLLHGNVAGVAASAIGGYAARTAKAEGNLLTARTLSALAQHISNADGDIAKIAGKAVGRYARDDAELNVDDRPRRNEVSYDKAAKAVRDAQQNPMLIESRVRALAGPWAQQAPNVYASMLGTSMRIQEFLAGKLPLKRTDPFSLTPHLEEDGVSDSEKFDFTEYARACADPITSMNDVVTGYGSPQQVEAVAAVYPGIYDQTKAEVARRIASLQKPLSYERSVNIGTLLDMDTNEVMTGDFQTVLSGMYSSRSESEKMPGGSKPRGVNSRLSKSFESSSQQMQDGEAA